jgi:ectoine hydroxylase-related dioxygenase (phytanoyl-CoA dioxygenase family)
VLLRLAERALPTTERTSRPIPDREQQFDSQVCADGFAIVERVFDHDEIDAVSQALNSTPLVRSRAGARHAMRNRVVAELARDPRLLHLVRSVLGPDALPYRATLFDKSPTSNWLVVWHQDTALPLCRRTETTGWGPWSVKDGVIYAHAPAAALNRVLVIRVHLDDSTASNGPLRCLPGTHRHGVLSDEAIKCLTRASEPVDLFVARGGVLAMRPLLVHASSKARSCTSRRVLHIEYAASMQIEAGLELALA